MKNTITLSNGKEMPLQQMGTWQVLPNFAQLHPTEEQYAYLQEITYKSVSTAIKVGYRAFDTAFVYNNEEAIGNAIADSGIPRSEFFLTTKFVPGFPGSPEDISDEEKAYEMTVGAIENSLAKLETDYIDLFLMHGYAAARYGVWKAMEEYYKAGKILSLGISTFDITQIDEFLPNIKTKPVVLQTQVHPYLHDTALIAHARENGMAIQSLMPLMHGGAVMSDETITALAEKIGVSQPQVILRWHLQKGYAALPKSNREENIRKNFDICNFELSEADMATIDSLAKPEPAFGIPTPNA